ncbi:polysaccharide deacetylase family protein [Agarivorans sp. TSD2052]|uniref:polysaccharide deacetylase family protein n=1 Tax=Agarivorans sp. TSD2052 TaxID=2937286 RepID=UPI00200E99A5|nr:polysaccharide deacetylase family protein [Agarivorans sp. TSD2052]UPW19203.1 polysaccharide deacetylase family protein [Agarivorans sp. TSD2052]
MLNKAKIRQLIFGKRSISDKRWQQRLPGIYVFNYHRIGDARSSDFDPNVFSCTAEQFEQHLLFYKQQFDVLNEAQLLSLLDSQQAITKPYALITFDDGYIDSYQQAFPLLKKHGLSAMFFVVTEYTNGGSLAWWDEVAWLVKHSKVSQLKLEHWANAVDLSGKNEKQNIRKMLFAFKADQQYTMEQKLVQLRAICKAPALQNSLSLFANWQQLQEMAASGMTIGSHTRSHPILAHLEPDQQREELDESRRYIENQLNSSVCMLAYPVGSTDSFTEVTQMLAKETGYRLAFSFMNGINKQLDEQSAYSLKRISVDGNKSVDSLKVQIMELNSKLGN